MKKYFKWTPERLDELRELAASDHTYASAAEAMGRPKYSVADTAKRYGIKFGLKGWVKKGKAWTPEEMETLRSVLARGGTWRTAMDALPNRTEDAIRKKAAAMNLPFRREREHLAPIEEPRPKQRRACLSCGETFLSAGNGHRVCDECKRSEAYRLGNEYVGAAL